MDQDQSENFKISGEVEIVVTRRDGTSERFKKKNKILKTGRAAMAKAISNSFGGNFQLFVSTVTFGDGGTDGGTPKFIDETRTSLFGSAVANKPIIATIDDASQSAVTFTSVLTFDDANGSTINEMALKMNNGDYFSLLTFGGIAKDDEMQVIFNWVINML